MTDDTLSDNVHPPLRKKSSQVKTVALKQIHVEQHSKLQHKQQHDNDLLEDMVNFAKRRSQLEKDYASALLKLASGLQSRKDPHPIPELGEETRGRTMATVWRTVLEETERVAKVRLQAADTYMQEVHEPIKSLKTLKAQHMKKLLDQFATIQGEVTQSVRELNKAKKIYTDEEKLAHDARKKSSEVEEKVKRRSTGLFSSLASLQKNSAKLIGRKEACESKSTSARNEYLLNLAATNAHLVRFYSNDMPNLMRDMDGELYEKIQHAFVELSKTELECCGITQECFSKVLCDSTMISRDYNTQCLVNHNVVFTDLIQYSFEQYEGDPTIKVQDDPKGEYSLSQEAKKWASKVVKENKVIYEYGKVLQSLINGTYTGEKKVADPTSPDGEAKDGKQPEVEMTVDSCKEFIRKAETAKLKAEARLDLLREAGVDVDDWLMEANRQNLSPIEDEPSRVSVGDVSYRTCSSGGQSEPSPNGVHHMSYNYDEDFSDETFDQHSPALTNNSTSQQSPAFTTSTASAGGASAIALYDFTGSNADELNIAADETITILGPGDAPGWVKAMNAHGQEGLVPESYVQVWDESAPQTAASTTSGYSHTAVNGDVFNDPWGDSGNPPSSDEPAQQSADSDKKFVFPESSPNVNIPQAVDIPQIQSETDNPNSYSSTDYEMQNLQSPVEMMAGSWVRAVYDYDASNPEEISFQEGQLIKLIKRDDDVGDGWWTGDIDGRQGLFPSLVVEELADQFAMDSMTSPCRPGPPEFAPPDAPDGNAPPPVTVTLPTPSDEGMSPKLLESDHSIPEPINEGGGANGGDQDDGGQSPVRPGSPSSPMREDVAFCGRRESLDPGTAAVDLSTMAEDRVVANNEYRRKSGDENCSTLPPPPETGDESGASGEVDCSDA